MKINIQNSISINYNLQHVSFYVPWYGCRGIGHAHGDTVDDCVTKPKYRHVITHQRVNSFKNHLIFCGITN